jgi:hypothetical protein
MFESANKDPSSFIVTVEVVERVPPSPHNSIKLLKIEHAVAIPIGLLQHFLELLVRYFFPNFTGNSL